MSEISQKETLPLRRVLQGSVLILISNLIYISNNYLVAWTGLKAPEIALVRGGLQLAIFGALVCRRRETDKESGVTHKQAFLYLLLSVYGFTASTASFACLAAIPFMPIGDLIVICFTAPVFSVFLDRIVLKRSFTLLSICLCFLIVIGDVLVIQPPFIFPKEDSEHNATHDTQLSEESMSVEKHGEHYFLGVALCLYTAAAISVANVVGAKCNKMDISTSNLMLVSGCSSLILSLVSTVFLPNRVLSDPQSLTTEAAVLLPVSATITMLAYWTITLAISITSNPTLIAILRSTEILISLVTESVWWNELPAPCLS